MTRRGLPAGFVEANGGIGVRKYQGSIACILCKGTKAERTRPGQGWRGRVWWLAGHEAGRIGSITVERVRTGKSCTESRGYRDGLSAIEASVVRLE